MGRKVYPLVPFVPKIVGLVAHWCVLFQDVQVCELSEFPPRPRPGVVERGVSEVQQIM